MGQIGQLSQRDQVGQMGEGWIYAESSSLIEFDSVIITISQCQFWYYKFVRIFFAGNFLQTTSWIISGV